MDASKMTSKQRIRASRARPGERELLDEVRRARQLLDADAGGPLAWICAFVRQNPKEWTPSESAAYGYRLLALFNPLPSNLVGGTNLRPLKPREVVALHAGLRAFLVSAVASPSGTLLPIPTEGLTASLVRVTAPGVKPAIFAKSRGGPGRAILFHEVAELVVATDRLIACPGPSCGQPFLALRKMRFCSPKCAERWWNRDKVTKYRKGGPRDAR